MDLAALSDTVTRTAVAVLTLVGSVVLVVGLARAWSGRRRVQVVIEDVAAVEGMAAAATASLSPQLRQAVLRALATQTRDASYAVVETMRQDVDAGLLRAQGALSVTRLTAGLRASTQDSTSTLQAGLRAVAPKEGDGLLAVLGAALPAQRGWVVRTSPVFRGAGVTAEVGLSLELAELGSPPDALTAFWLPALPRDAGATDAAAAEAVRAVLHRLLEPAALWVATRLIARQLGQARVPGRWRPLVGADARQDLAGLRVQLAGQMALYASQRQKSFDRGFADQALHDLGESARLLPGYFRPSATEGAVRERLGWSHRQAGETDLAAKEFVRAVRCYQDALDTLLAGAPGPRSAEADRQLARLQLRQVKCRLLTGRRAERLVASQDLDAWQPDSAVDRDLYNAACLFAVASALPGIAPDAQDRHRRRAWELLGCALLLSGPDGPWELALTDIELEALDAREREAFLEELRVRSPGPAVLSLEQAAPLVSSAVEAVLAGGVAGQAERPDGLGQPAGRDLQEQRLTGSAAARLAGRG